jgi:hypothetical protein
MILFWEHQGGLSDAEVADFTALRTAKIKQMRWSGKLPETVIRTAKQKAINRIVKIGVQ